MKPTDLRGILQYIPRFREKTFILSVDGAIVTDENFANLLLDVAVLRSLNIRVVIIHGASAQILLLRYTQVPPGGSVELWTVNGGDHGLFWMNLTPHFLELLVDWLLAHPKP